MGWGDDIVAREQAAFVRRLSDHFVADLASAYAASVAAASREASGMMREIARVVQAGVGDPALERAHRTIAAKAQDSVVRSFDQTVTARRKPEMRGYDYRRGANKPGNIRYAGGKLRAALRSEEFWSADARGIRFINTSMLDAKARHWARLSAGAGSRGHGSRQRFEVRWGNLTVAALGLDMNSSPAFMIPRGYWRAPGGGPVAPGARGTAAFFPIGEGPFPSGRVTERVDRARWGGTRVPLQRRRLSRGIAGRNFLDAGVRRLALELGPTYERMYEEWFQQRVVTVRPTRPTVRVRRLSVRAA